MSLIQFLFDRKKPAFEATPRRLPAVPFDPAEAYWNQRFALAKSKSRILALSQAVGRPSDLWPYQFAQLTVMALEFAPDVILELGRGYGNSTCAYTEAANQLGPHSCRVVSICNSDSWDTEALPRLTRVVPSSWFDPLTIERGDILQYDYAKVLRGKKRVLLFWDAHGFEIAECVLSRILPAIAALPHLVIMHDLSDSRYQSAEGMNYGGNPLWKGNDWGGTRLKLGYIDTAVEQAVAILDFATRNRLTLDSADHSFHSRFDNNLEERAEMQKTVGPELFNVQAHWFWFTLNEHAGPYTFPAVPTTVRN